MDEHPRLKFDYDQQLIDDAETSEQDKQAARLRQLFWRARYQPVKHSDRPADTFLGLWANLLLDSSARRLSFPKKQIRKNLSRVFEHPQLIEALSAAGPEGAGMLLEELKDSARLYFTTCRMDSNYSSLLFNMIKMKDDQVADKAARSTAKGILVPLLMLDEMPWRDEMIEAVCSAYPEVFTSDADCLDNKISELSPEMLDQITRIRTRFLNTHSC